MDDLVPASPKEAVGVVRDQLGYGLRFLGKHGWRLLLWFVCLLLPLWIFAALVGEMHEKEVFPFDAPVLTLLHAMATPALDHFFVLMTRLGYQWGVVPLDLIVLLSLALRRRFRDGLFFGIADFRIGRSEYRREKPFRAHAARSVAVTRRQRPPTVSQAATRWALPHLAWL